MTKPLCGIVEKTNRCRTVGEQTKPIAFSNETVDVDARTVRIVFSERAQISVHAQKLSTDSANY